MVSIKPIDQIDATILSLLQKAGRLKRKTIAEHVGLSVPSVSDRMRKLEERGVITGYHAVVDVKKLNLDITAFIRVSVDTSGRHDAMVEYLSEHEEILEIHSVTGEGSHILKAVTKNTTSLEELLAKIQAWPGVTGTHTSIVLSSYKETRRIHVVAPAKLRRRKRSGRIMSS